MSTAQNQVMPSWCEKLLSGELPPAYCDQHLGLRPVHFELGHSIWELLVEKHHTNVHGVVGGGIMAACLDTALGAAGGSTLEGTKTAMTTHHSVDLLAAARGPSIRFSGQVVHRGKQRLYVEGEARSSEGKLLARARQTMLVLERHAARRTSEDKS